MMVGGREANQFLRDAVKKIFIGEMGGSIGRGVTQFAALSIVAASK